MIFQLIVPIRVLKIWRVIRVKINNANFSLDYFRDYFRDGKSKMSSTAEQVVFLVNLRLHLIDLSRRLEQDSSDDVADYVLYRLQQVARTLVRHGTCRTSKFSQKLSKETTLAINHATRVAIRK